MDERYQEQFDALLEEYNDIWTQEDEKNYGYLRYLNRELMNLCRLPGYFYENERIVCEQLCHDKDAPLPVGIYDVLPARSCPERENIIKTEGRNPDAFFDDALEINYYYIRYNPNDHAHPNRIRIYTWNKYYKELRDNDVAFDIGDRYIDRIITVSNRGEHLLLELKNNNVKNYQGQTAYSDIVYASSDGYFIKDVYQYCSKTKIQAVLSDNGRISPPNGYLWIPGKADMFYIEERDREVFIDDDPARWGKKHGYSCHMPKEIYPSDSYKYDWDYNRKPIMVESMHYSINGEEMAILAEDKKAWSGCGHQQLLYLLDKADGEWKEMLFGGGHKIFFSRDHRFMMCGDLIEDIPGIDNTMNTEVCTEANTDVIKHKESVKDIEQGSMIWRLYYTIPTGKNNAGTLWKSPVCSPEKTIASFSYDLCSLLDKRGIPVYDIFWKYEQASKQNFITKDDISIEKRRPFNR